MRGFDAIDTIGVVGAGTMGNGIAQVAAANGYDVVMRDVEADFVESGFDILNPVQCSAAGMGALGLKEKFGDQITFWGGGVDTQRTLPFGTPEQIRAEVRERLRIFGPGGGLVFNTIHNVQAGVPAENLVALYETVQEHRTYPL